MNRKVPDETMDRSKPEILTSKPPTIEEHLCPYHGNAYSDGCVCCGAAKHRNRTSKTLVERLRKDASGFKFVGPSVTADLECEAADEIERLTAELAEALRWVDTYKLARRQVEAERDRLREELGRPYLDLLAERDGIMAERDDYCRQLTQGIRAMRDVCVERDRLRAELSRLQVKPLAVENVRLAADNNRLRAALNEAADLFSTERKTYPDWHARAQAWLKRYRAPDETSDGSKGS